MATTTLNIQGMTCGGCVNSVTRVLTGIAGVSKRRLGCKTRQNAA
ncbi:heavy-metal-associated domain-containing protein [Kingella oralis]